MTELPPPAGDSAVRLSPDEATRLDLAVRRLAPLERRILTLSRLKGKSHSEIAVEVGHGEDEIKRLLFKALLALARIAETRND